NTFDAAEPSTHGIQLESWSMECGDQTVQINVWDFGGQDIYRNTHRLFLQTRAVFLIVWDRETEQTPSYQEDAFTFDHEPLKYWLDYVEDVAPGAEVIVVENKCDEGKRTELPVPVMRGAVLGFSAKTGYNRTVLLEFIRSQCQDELANPAYRIGVGRQAVKR